MSNGVTAWSYSRYADYEQCPLMFKLKHLDRIKPPSSPQMQRGSDIHKEGEVFLITPETKKVPVTYANFKDQMTQLKTLSPVCELQEGFTSDWKPATASGRDPNGWFAKDTWLRIVIDVKVLYDDHTAEVIDFKTGKMYGTNENQVELFSCAPFIKDPELTNVTARLWYLDSGDEVIREYSRKDYLAIKKDWTKRVKPMFVDQRWAPKPGPKCRWCHFRAENGGPCKF